MVSKSTNHKKKETSSPFSESGDREWDLSFIFTKMRINLSMRM
jgi:hypothetical protein